VGLEGEIDSRLWTAVQKSYDDGDYAGSILDSFYFLSDLIRDKSGCESDGHALIGAAFGGANPIVKVNAFRTETDQSEQRGIEQLLRGLYGALRNPRSHEKRVDPAETADTVIKFISLVVGMIDKSRSPFDTQQIVGKVFDRHFVPTEEYAGALVSKIPLGKRYDVVSQVFAKRMEGKLENVGLFTRALLDTLSGEAQASYWDMVSTALEEATNDAEFRTATFLASSEWGKLSDLARLRTENRLIASIREGEYDPVTGNCSKGSLGTWASRLTSHFTMKSELLTALSLKVLSGDREAREYVMKYFRGALIDPKTEADWDVTYALQSRLEADDMVFFDALTFIGKGSCHKSWDDELGDAMTEFRKRNPEAADSEVPF
jgi:uncharacterized protein (TIGR02391 family)